MEQKKYWQSFGELNNSEASKKAAENEFAEELSLEGLDGKGLLDAKTPRRDFLKYLGFSTAAAALAAGCETPVRKAIPYVNKPDELIPGVANYYATTYVSGTEVVPVVAKVRDGRPIKLEGNSLSSITKGGTSPRVQAAVLDLYDTARLRYPVQIVNDVPQEVSSFEAFDKMIGDAMAGLGSSTVALVTPTITSPTTKQIITAFLAKFPGSVHVQYDADSQSGILLANEASYGKRTIPSYRFDNADVIVSLGADFLGTWISPVEFARQYVKKRKIDQQNPAMSKHYQFESMLSVTGANADDRYAHKPSDTGAIALALLSALGGSVTAPTLDPKIADGIKKAAADLQKSRGKALVVSGSNNKDVQVIVNAINEAIGANGSTIDWSTTHQTKQGVDSDFNTLVSDLDGGKVGAVLFYNVNPAYDYFDAEKFKSALKKAKVSVSFNDRLDETTELCKFALPAPHFLESWGDAEPKSGYISLIQPTINPLFKTRHFQDSLLKWSGSTVTYEASFKQYWMDKLGGLEAYEKALQDGVLEPATPPAASAASYNAGALSASAAALSSSKKGGKLELVLYQNVAMATGQHANNPWLLELPDPITRADWDNYAIVSPKFAKDNKDIFDNLDLSVAKQADKYEVHPDRQLVKIKSGNKEVVLPVLVVPGVANDVVAVAVGYGRQSAKPENTGAYIGKAAVGAGKNVFHLATSNGSTVDWFSTDVSLEKASGTYKVAQVQTHSSYEGRTQVVKEMTLVDFRKEPDEVLKERDEELKRFGGLKNFEKQGTLYPYFDKPGIKWGMSVDMNSCIGCSACVVACHVENNVPIVGKSEVLRYHDMHWLRIDRYFSGNLEDPSSIQTVFQPMLCQHCDNAPCENVCPVSATNHSSEGLNQMAYNRCIGTRYCANNCPYKVRRFNWADYTGADSFPDNQVGHLDDSVLMMNDELTRMVLNPDVTVRSRGVMEKCTFCVQRLQEGKLKAKKENRPLKDMEDVMTACQQACPTEAIVFGNVNDASSYITKTRQDNKERLYYVIEEVHTLPNVSYLAKIRNTSEIRGREVEAKRESTEKPV